MTITIELPEDTLTQLRADAQAQGRTPEEVAADLVGGWYEGADPDAVAAIAEGLAEMENGQGRPFEEFAQEFAEHFEAEHRSTKQHSAAA